MKKYNFIFMLFAILMFMSCGLDEDIFVMRANAGLGFVVTNADDWKKALKIIESGDRNDHNAKNYIITVKGDMPLSGNSIHFPNNRTITINGKGRLYLTSKGSMFDIGSFSTIIIDSADLIFEGLTNSQNGVSSDNEYPLISVQSGTLKLQNGTIRNNTCIASGADRAVGGGVQIYAGGAFIMTGGTISGNTVSARPGYSNSFHGGGVSVNKGSFTMTGGTISGNKANNGNGGGVYISGDAWSTPKTSFTMSGGTISGNSAKYGGGVSISQGTFTKSGGGIIYGENAPAADKNTAATRGNAVYWDGGSRDTTLGESDNFNTN